VRKKPRPRRAFQISKVVVKEARVVAHCLPAVLVVDFLVGVVVVAVAGPSDGRTPHP
jgi:hypothetical protein